MEGLYSVVSFLIYGLILSKSGIYDDTPALASWVLDLQGTATMPIFPFCFFKFWLYVLCIFKYNKGGNKQHRDNQGSQKKWLLLYRRVHGNPLMWQLPMQTMCMGYTVLSIKHAMSLVFKMQHEVLQRRFSG